MKILLFSQFYKPESIAPAFRAAENARFWAESGNEVTVFTGYPNYPQGRIFEGYTPKLLTEDEDGGVRVLRSKLVAKPNINVVNRLKNALSFFAFAIINILWNGKKIKKDYDVVIGTSGVIFTALAAWFFAAIHKLPFVFEIRDITFGQMVATGSNPSSPSVRFMKALELFLCKRAKKVVVVTYGFKAKLYECGIPIEKIEVITNGVDVNHLAVAVPNINETFTISYFGTMGISQNLLSTIPYITVIKEMVPNTEYLLIGDGAQKDKINEVLNSGDYPYIKLFHSMTPEELEPFYTISSLNLVVLRNSSNFKYTIPSKIFQIMGRGQAVLFIGPKGEAADIINRFEAGIVLTENEAENILKLSEFFNNTNYLEKIKDMGKNGRKAVVDYYDREKLAYKYIEVLKTAKKRG